MPKLHLTYGHVTLTLTSKDLIRHRTWDVVPDLQVWSICVQSVLNTVLTCTHTHGLNIVVYMTVLPWPLTLKYNQTYHFISSAYGESLVSIYLIHIEISWFWHLTSDLEILTRPRTSSVVPIVQVWSKFVNIIFRNHAHKRDHILSV